MTPSMFNGQDGDALVGWRAWLDDGTIWDSDRHTWAEVPGDGLQVLQTYHWTQHDPPRRTRMRWAGYDEFSIPGVVGGAKLGRLMGDAEFKALQDIAHADPWRPRDG